MGRVLIFLALVVLLFIIILGIQFFFHNRQLAARRGLNHSGRQMRELQRTNQRYIGTLKEIREIGASSEIINSDPLWSLIVNKVDQALETEEKQ